MKKNNPKIKLEKAPFDATLEWLTFALLIFHWVVTLYSLAVLPETIPTRFDTTGEPSSFGNKFTFILLPIFGTFTVLSI